MLPASDPDIGSVSETSKETRLKLRMNGDQGIMMMVTKSSGANSVLVAPISLGANVTVGAGSTLTQSVPAGALAVSRAPQRIRPDWPGPPPAGESAAPGQRLGSP